MTTTPSASASPSQFNGADASVLTLKRGLAILDVFSNQPQRLGVNEIGRLVSLHKSTVSRLCGTLEQMGYLERDADGKFLLGSRVYQLAGASANAPDLRAAARPILHGLVDSTGETAHLAVLAGVELITVDVVEGHHLMQMQGRIGQRQLFHASALGLAILAGLPAWRVDELLGRGQLVRLTPDTIVDRTQLRQRLSEIRTQGYSVDFEGVEDGLRCIGAAVRDANAMIVGALSVSGPRHRLGPEAIARLGPLVRGAADELATRLGAPASFDAHSSRA